VHAGERRTFRTRTDSMPTRRDNMDSSTSRRQRRPDTFALVIFGATGDLTRRKLLPAVYSLFSEGLLPDGFSVVAFARRDKNDETFRAEIREAIGTFARLKPDNERVWSEFASRIHYHQASLDDPAGFRSLRQRLERMAEANGTPCNCLFYLATPPSLFAPIAEMLDGAGLSRRGVRESPWSRIVVEKPFGADLQSARQLAERIEGAFAEEQVFRIDHYLGKETVQNILVFRFANSIFEPIWNHKYVDHVQITVSENMGVGARGRYYDDIGALRDMVQNHMLNALCLVAMEAPVRFEADAVRDEKVKVLRALSPIPVDCLLESVVRAQYRAGTDGGESVAGYREEEGVAPDSTTETYVALRAFVENWRWAGVPFYLRTGKRLPARISEISVHFKRVPLVLFRALPAEAIQSNILAMRIQPNEGISLRFQVKVPGSAMRTAPLKMDFSYAESFGRETPEAYERLLLDAALGDSTLFIRRDEVEAAWTFVDPILRCWQEQAAPAVPTYAAGSWGPEEADELIEGDGRHWYLSRRPMH